MAATAGKTRRVGKQPAKRGAERAAAAPSGASRSTAAAGGGEDWEAAKEILAAHRTLARAERREVDLASSLKAESKAVERLASAVKKAKKQLRAAREDLAASVESRQKAADRLAKLEKKSSVGGKKK